MQEIQFQLCNERDEPTKEGIAQIKEDGRRVAVIKKENEISFWGRDFIMKDRYPEILEAFKQIPGNFIVDCEFAVFKKGKSERGLLQTRDKTKDKFKIRLMTNTMPVTAVIIDILELNGQDLRNKEYQERKKILNNALITNDRVAIIEDWRNPLEAWQHANIHNLEGIVIKDVHAKYVGKRTDAWLKVKRKEVIKKTFTGYETSNAGITLTNPEGDRVACHGEKHLPVKKTIDDKGFAICEIRRMAGVTEKGRSREIVFYKLIK